MSERFNIDNIRILSIIPGKLKSTLKATDTIVCNSQELPLITALLKRQGIDFISQTNSLNISEIFILVGVENVRYWSKEQKRDFLQQSLNGYKAINHQYRNGELHFPNVVSVVNHIERLENSGYKKCLKMLLQEGDKDILQQHEYDYQQLLDEVVNNGAIASDQSEVHCAFFG